MCFPWKTTCRSCNGEKKLSNAVLNTIEPIVVFWLNQPVILALVMAFRKYTEYNSLSPNNQGSKTQKHKIHRTPRAHTSLIIRLLACNIFRGK